MDGLTLVTIAALMIPVAVIVAILVYHFTRHSMLQTEQQLTEQMEAMESQTARERDAYQEMGHIYEHVRNYHPYIIYVFDRYKELRSATVSAAKMIGFADGNIPEQTGVSYFIECGVGKEVIDEIIETLRKGHDYYNVLELKLKDAQGSFQIHAQQRKNADGEVEGCIVFVMDVTKQIQQNEKVVEALRMRDRLILAMSHEVRTPLNAIIGSADLMMLTDNLSEQEKVHMQNIREASQVLLNIVNETIDYAKIESNEMKVENKRFDFLECLLQIRTALYVKTLNKGIDFFLDIEPDIPKHIIGDEARLRQVISHLLSNAIRYTDEGFIRLRISKKKRGDRSCLLYEIEDTGIGIREEKQKNIFKAFSQISEKEHVYRSGIGLGLMVCQKLVSLMGGEIKFHSEWETGTTFYFELELLGSENDSIAQVRQPDQKSILICSDDELLARHLVDMAEKLKVRACWNHEMNMVEEFYTHIMIDNKMSNAREWLEREMPYSCEKILVIEDSRSTSRAMKKADRIMYYPIVCNMIADVLNKSELSNFNREKKGKRDLIFKVNGLNCLVVDDNSVNTMVATNILKQFGFITEEANSAAIAFKKIYAKKYDIIFMDYQMPEMDGIEATAEVRKLEYGKDTLIFALTANITEDIVTKFKDAGANDIIAKPLELKELSELLQKWIPEENETTEKKESCIVYAPAEEEPEMNEENPEMAAFVQAMKQVPEIDVKLGLSHVLGDMDGYVKILGISNSNISQAFESIKELIPHEKYDDMRIHFHSLKGIFANIGAQDISEESKKMEFAARDHDHIFIKTYLQGYLECVDRFMESLERGLAEFKQGNEEETGSVVLSCAEKKKLLEELSYLISRFEINDVGEILTRLIAASEKEEKDILIKTKNEIENFQYDKALELLAELSKE